MNSSEDMNIIQNVKELCTKSEAFFTYIKNANTSENVIPNVRYYLFEILFYIYYFMKYVFSLFICLWNNSIDSVITVMPYSITHKFPLTCFKIGNEYEFFTYNGYKETIDVCGNIQYVKTYSCDKNMIFKRRNEYDYIIVNHYDGIKDKEIFKRVFNREQLEKIDNSDEMNKYVISKKNPFIFLSVNLNKKSIDISDINDLDIDDNMYCYNKLKSYFVKENKIDRNFLNLFMNIEYNTELDKYPNYIIDLVTNDIKEKHYKKDDSFEYLI